MLRPYSGLRAVLWCRFLKRKGLYLLGIASLCSAAYI